jgi:hypothetical protein
VISVGVPVDRRDVYIARALTRLRELGIEDVVRIVRHRRAGVGFQQVVPGRDVAAERERSRVVRRVLRLITELADERMYLDAFPPCSLLPDPLDDRPVVHWTWPDPDRGARGPSVFWPWWMDLSGDEDRNAGAAGSSAPVPGRTLTAAPKQHQPPRHPLVARAAASAQPRSHSRSIRV